MHRLCGCPKLGRGTPIDAIPYIFERVSEDQLSFKLGHTGFHEGADDALADKKGLGGVLDGEAGMVSAPNETLPSQSGTTDES